MKRWKKIALLSTFLSLTVALYAVPGWLTTDAPERGDNEQRSLWKVNDILYTGSPASGAAPAIANATAVIPYASGGTVTTGSGTSLAEILNGVAGTYMVRQVVIISDPDNTDDIGLKKGTIGLVYRELSAGNEWVITAPAGAAFDSNLIRAVAISGSQNVIVFALR